MSPIGSENPQINIPITTYIIIALNAQVWGSHHFNAYAQWLDAHS